MRTIVVMLALDGLLSVLFLGFWLFCLFDVITSDPAQVRNLPKVAWVLIVAILFAMGGLIWVLLGRPSERTWPRRGSRSPQGSVQPRGQRPLGPEDSPEYEERIRRAQERLRPPDDRV